QVGEMVPDSRTIPLSLCKIKVDPVGQVQHAKEETHQIVGRSSLLQAGQGGGDDEKAGASQDEDPAEEFDPSLHEERGGGQGAYVKGDPGRSDDPSGRAVMQNVAQAHDQPYQETGQDGGGHPPGGRRPKRLVFAQSLFSDQEQGGGEGDDADPQP